MPQNDDLKKRRANALHVEATNKLSGVSVSPLMTKKMKEYASGHLSSAELLAEAKRMHIASKLSSPPKK